MIFKTLLNLEVPKIRGFKIIFYFGKNITLRPEKDVRTGQEIKT